MLAISWSGATAAVLAQEVAPAAAQQPPAAAGAQPTAPPAAEQSQEVSATPDAVPAAPPAVEEVPPNRAPHAADDRLVLVRGGTASIDLFANDSDPDGDRLTVLGGTSAGHGSLSFDGAVVTFTADADFVGDDSFLYVVGDARGATARASVWITVTNSPVAAPVAAKPWNVRPPTRPVPVQAAGTRQVVAAEPAVAVLPQRQTASRLRPVAAAAAAAPARLARAVPPMGPSTTPYVAPPTRPATLPFTGGPTDVLLPLGLGLLLAGGALTGAGRRRA